MDDAGVKSGIRGIDGRAWFIPDPLKDHTNSRIPVPELAAHLDRPLFAYQAPDGEVLFAVSGRARMGEDRCPPGGSPLLAYVSPLRPSQLGDPGFLKAHGVRYPYIAGAMAGGIGSEEIVVAMAKTGMLGFFGSGGLSLSRIEGAIRHIQDDLRGHENYGFNLLANPELRCEEEATAALYMKYGVRKVSASAYMELSPAIVWYRAKGIHQLPSGEIAAPNQVLAKLSRTEVAQAFMEPPPVELLDQLLREGRITREEANLARYIPMAEDVTVEADSGGHTDNRPALPLLSAIRDLRDQIVKGYSYPRPIRVGQAGGIGTPVSVAAAFTAGAAYVLTGSINQACAEAGTSDLVKEMLSEADMAAVAMAPAVDMFEMGTGLQVLKHRTLFAARARKLSELYRLYKSLDEIPTRDREQLEKRVFRCTFDEIWQQTAQYFQDRDPSQVEQANRNPRHKMALVFRWYLGMSSRWPKEGNRDRSVDFQVWCGPAMGAFNQWVKGTFMEAPSNRRVADVARNLLYGACVLQRLYQLRLQLGRFQLSLPAEAFRVSPRTDWEAPVEGPEWTNNRHPGN